MEVEWWSFNLCQGLPFQVLYKNSDERSLCLLFQELAVQYRRQICKQIIAIMYIFNVYQTEIGQRKEWYFSPNLEQGFCSHSKLKSY